MSGYQSDCGEYSPRVGDQLRRNRYEVRHQCAELIDIRDRRFRNKVSTFQGKEAAINLPDLGSALAKLKLEGKKTSVITGASDSSNSLV